VSDREIHPGNSRRKLRNRWPALIAGQPPKITQRAIDALHVSRITAARIEAVIRDTKEVRDQDHEPLYSS
jgi:hypothetical protein